MNNDKKQKLIDLGVERLIATPKENIQRFKKKLAVLKRSKRFTDWRGSSGFARDLTMLLQDLKSGVSDPLTGVEMIAVFYETDQNIFERCDDSGGNVGYVFRHDAKEVFVEYASRCADKTKVVDIILNLNRKNGYGVRDALIDCAGDCLPEPFMMLERTIPKLTGEKIMRMIF